MAEPRIPRLWHGPDIVDEAFRLALAGIHSLQAGDFVKAARLLKAAGREADRAEALLDRIFGHGAGQ